MLLQNKHNNILIYGASYLGGYQDKPENIEICKGKNIFMSWNQNKKSVELAMHITHTIIKI